MSALQGTQLAYQPVAMKTLLTLSSLAGLGYGAWHFRKYLNEREKNRITETRIEIWETEGGAVPVHATRTAQQISPAPKPRVSPRSVG